MDHDQQRDHAEEQYRRDYCAICNSSPCSWNGLYPDAKHTPRLHDHEKRCGRVEHRYFVISPAGGDIIVLSDDVIAGRSCYVCRKQFTHDSHVVPTDILVADDVELGVKLKGSGYYLSRHRDCSWATWPNCGCPYDYVEEV